MAVNTYSVTVGMVTGRLPLDGRRIDTDTTPLSTGDIEEFIKAGASQITPLLTNTDRSATITDDDMLKQVQDAVVDYAVWKCLAARPNIPRVDIDAAERAWLAKLSRYGSRAEFLKTQAANRTETNVDTTAGKSSLTFGGLNYEF